MTSPNPLSQQLRTLRKEAGLSGAEAARRAGITQSKVSRAETGTFLPSEDDVIKLCRVYGAKSDARRELLEMTRELRGGSTPARIVLQRGGWGMQQRIGKLEAAATEIRTFTPAAVHGLIQTRKYVTALFGDSLTTEDLARTVDARLSKQSILSSARRFVFLMAEGALRWNMGGADVMAEQLDHIVAVSQMPNVKVGVIPWTTPANVPALHGFTIYDSRAVLLGTLTATAVMTERNDVGDYETHWAELEPFASWGDDARTVLSQAADDYRSILSDAGGGA